MLIINADDWGADHVATDNSLNSYENGRITSASAMVFMPDSERAAEIARSVNLRTGLHLNFNEELAESAPIELRSRFARIATYLNANRYRPLIYNPLLSRAFEYVYRAQYDEYMRLYGEEPEHINGHRHMHLCLNVVAGRLLPAGCRLRISFTFFDDEKSLLNRLYRRGLNAALRQRHVCADRFYSIQPIARRDRIARIFEQARTNSVELMVHPSRHADRPPAIIRVATPAPRRFRDYASRACDRDFSNGT